MEFNNVSFNALTTIQLFDIYKLRNEVFIVEQKCAYQDVDDLDKIAKHIMLFDKEILVAYARLIPPNICYNEPVIGRVVVKKIERNKKIGKLLMNYCINNMQTTFKNMDVVISAQFYLLKFYNELGFIEEGNTYFEDDILHIKMRLLFHY